MKHEIEKKPDRRLRLLVVEDHTIHAIDLECILEDLGHIVLSVAARPERALEAIEGRRNDIDGAFVDANLAGVSSKPVIERLREYGISTVLVSGYNADYLRTLGFGEPALEKPYDKSEIAAALANFGRG